MSFLGIKFPTKDNKKTPAPVLTGSEKSYRLDAVGQVCPFPLVEAKKAIAQINSGDSLQIDFDCTQATDSIPAWAAAQGHEVLDFKQLGEAIWTITLRKA